MSWEIKCSHATFLPHLLVVQHAVVLTPITTSSMQEDNILIAFSGLLVEYLEFV